MTTVIQSPAIDTGILEITRSALVETAVKTGKVIVDYSKAISDVFDLKDTEGRVITKWYDLKGKEKRGIKAERALFANILMDRDTKFIKKTNADGTRTPTATVDTYWQRVKEASGYVPSGRVTGGTDVDSKTLAELKTMINRILKSEEEGQECNASMFKGNLMEIYEGMGGDVDKLG
jgi:hypothetical protein